MTDHSNLCFCEELVWLSSSTVDADRCRQRLLSSGWVNPPITITDENSANEAIGNRRYVAFRAADPCAMAWFRTCLDRHRLPVPVGNTAVLPEPIADSTVPGLFTLGEAPVELNQLPACLRSSPPLPSQAAGMHTITCPSPENWRLTLDLEKTFDLRANPFPAFREDGSMIRESDLFRSLWLKTGRRFPRESSRPILVLGAGRFLKRLLMVVHDMPGGPALLGVADDAATTDTFEGLQVRTPAAWKSESFAAVLLATDAIEERLAARAREVFGPDTILIRPHEWMIADCDTDLKAAEPMFESDNVVGPGLRLAPPRKIEAAMVCVGYGDMLASTLPRNRDLFENIAIATTEDDHETQMVAESLGVRTVVSDRLHCYGAAFNKGCLLNEALAALDFDDWIMVTDADILFHPDWRKRWRNRLFHRDALYYATRVDLPETNTDDWLQMFDREPATLGKLPFRMPGRNRMPWGYCQLFHAESFVLRNRKYAWYPETFPHAADVDYAFQELWPDAMKILLPELLGHIQHGPEGVNWHGRKSRPLTVH